MIPYEKLVGRILRGILMHHNTGFRFYNLPIIWLGNEEDIKAVHEIAPGVAQKIESGKIKAPKKD